MLFLLEDIGDGISLKGIDEVDVGKVPPRPCVPRLYGVTKTHGDRRFAIAVKTITGGERPQRKRAAELKMKRTRNLKKRVERASACLAFVLPRIKREGGSDLDIEEAERLFKELLPGVKEAFGWPRQNPVGCSYQVNRDVIESATTDQGRTLVGLEVRYGIILSDRLRLIEARLKHDLPEEAEGILQALRNTATRDHLAVISMTADRRDETRLTIVDQGKNSLEMPAWKLLDLLNNPDMARKLFTITEDSLRERYPEVVCNLDKLGDLVAKFNPLESSLEVIIVASQEKKSNRSVPVSRQVIFYLDQDYLACLWFVLKRLTEDRQRYREALEKAEAHIDIDPFLLR